MEATNEDVLMQSLVENFEREGISDYEKALIFSTLNTKFNKTYEEIGKNLGISKQHVGSYISMLRLFDNTELAANPELADALHKMSEHHARVLSRVSDKKTRSDPLADGCKRQTFGEGSDKHDISSSELVSYSKANHRESGAIAGFEHRERWFNL